MNVEQGGALKFRQAWKKVMQNPKSRMWALNRSKPTTEELVRGIDNGTILRECVVDPLDETYDQASEDVRANIEHVVCSCYNLADGTNLGFALHTAPTHTSSRFIGRHDGAFGDGKVIVCRMVAGLHEERLFYFAFTWFVNGALLMWLESWNAGGTGQLTRSSVMAFSPQNASVLVRSAPQPCGDFLDARFERLLPHRTWCSAELCDTRVAGLCMFCAIRGCPNCMCPVSMRRRYGHGTQGSALRVTNALGVWKSLGKVLQAVPVAGSLAYNITKSSRDASTTSSNIIEAGVFSWTICATLKVTRHRCLQLHLEKSGVSRITGSTLLHPFEVRNADDAAGSEQMPPSSDCSTEESWPLTTSPAGNTSSATPANCDGTVNGSYLGTIQQSALMLDLW